MIARTAPLAPSFAERLPLGADPASVRRRVEAIEAECAVAIWAPMIARTAPLAPSSAERLPLGADPASVRRRVEAMEYLLEGMVKLPGFRRRVGLDVLLDSVPVIGDALAAVLGAWIVWEARNLAMPSRTIARMVGNVGLDWALGLIPFVGAVPDFFFRSNSRNLRLILRHLDRHHPATAVVKGQ